MQRTKSLQNSWEKLKKSNRLVTVKRQKIFFLDKVWSFFPSCRNWPICKPFAPCCYDHNRAGTQVPEEARARHCQHRLAPRQHALHGDRAHYTRWPPARQIVPGSSEMTNYNWTSPKKTKCSRLNLLWQKKTVKFEESWSNQIQQMNN